MQEQFSATHRIAITNSRIMRVDESGVELRYKDNADNDRHKTMHLNGKEFVRRYLLHVLPKGFTRIRHYGFLAGCCRTKRLAQIREALAQPEETSDEAGEHTNNDENVYLCPLCRIGHLRMIAQLLPQQMPIPQRRRR
jgi:hypothetical protein